MNRPPPRFPGAPPEPAPDDLSIPVLTERLGLPPLEFDTTLPMLESTGQNSEPMLEGLTALPDPPQQYTPPQAANAKIHPIAALPFPPIVYPEAAVPAALAPLAPTATRSPGVAAVAAPPAGARPTAPQPSTGPTPVTLAASGVVVPPAAAPASGPVTAPSAAPAARSMAGAAVEPTAASMAASAAAGQHWGRIEVELRSSILRQITEQLPREIDGIVQGRMQAAIDRLLGNLAEEIHLAVTASLADIVERAVRAELERMRTSNRG